MAELEAAAVHAFMHMARELDAHGFPRLAESALVAAQHEVSHAQRITRLALRFGYCPRKPSIEDSPVRSLEALAIDNAGEGCGRELFGAALNVYQAQTAADPDVAAVMGAIAADEMKHAKFSLDLAQALMPRLSRAQRERAREAQAATLLSFADEEGASDVARKRLGLFDGAEARTMAQRLLHQHQL